MLIETLDTARDLGRLKEILGVMVRHGFGDTVRRLGLADRLERAGQALNWTHAADLARVEPPVQVRLVANRSTGVSQGKNKGPARQAAARLEGCAPHFMQFVSLCAAALGRL